MGQTGCTERPVSLLPVPKRCFSPPVNASHYGPHPQAIQPLASKRDRKCLAAWYCQLRNSSQQSWPAGNHGFARQYLKIVPDSWDLINDQDAISRWGKFLTVYKRPGHRVIINHAGDLIVRPSFVEASYQRKQFGEQLAAQYASEAVHARSWTPAAC